MNKDQPTGRRLGGRIRLHIDVRFKGQRIQRIMSIEKYLAYVVLGHRLRRGETIHHANGDPLDCRPENIMILSEADHTNFNRLAGRFLKGRVFPLNDLNELVGGKIWETQEECIDSLLLPITQEPREYACIG